MNKFPEIRTDSNSSVWMKKESLRHHILGLWLGGFVAVGGDLACKGCGKSIFAGGEKHRGTHCFAAGADG